MLHWPGLAISRVRLGVALLCAAPATNCSLLQEAEAEPHRLHVPAHARRVSIPSLIPVFGRDTRPYHDLVRRAEALHGVSADLIHAIIRIESSYRPNAVSAVGAKGLMQLMPVTARAFGVRNAFDPAQNIFGGAAYLKRLAEWFQGDLVLILAAYHAGPAAVWRQSGVPDSFRTRAYVRAVINEFAAQIVSQNYDEGPIAGHASNTHPAEVRGSER